MNFRHVPFALRLISTILFFLFLVFMFSEISKIYAELDQEQGAQLTSFYLCFSPEVDHERGQEEDN